MAVHEASNRSNLLIALISYQSGEGLNEEYLHNFYRRFMESEAGHYKLFLELAENYVDKEKVRARWREWLSFEAALMPTFDLRGDRIH